MSKVLVLSRRFFVKSALLGFCAAPFGAKFALGATARLRGKINPDLLREAMTALQQHRGDILKQDFIGIIDFSLPSNQPRFHLVDLNDGGVASHLVAHGRGSDPAHTGWLQSFSNNPRSYATSAGAYLTGSPYGGVHGRSMRLEGLDSTNSNALSRAIVIHSAWYVNEQAALKAGRIGRSEGCFAVADTSLSEVMTALGPGRLIYAGKPRSV
jgi:L,D-transpeptidase catalytic domain